MAREASIGRIRTGRALITGLVFLPFTAYWSAEILSDIISSLLFPPVCALIVLTAINVALRRWLPSVAYSSAELTVTYIFLSMANAMCAEWTYFNAPYIAHYALFSERNPWDREHVLPHLPAWFYLTNAADLENYRRGGFGLATLAAALPIWAKPLAAWTLLFGLLCGAMLCINALMRELWTRRERLAFPMLQVPVLLTTPTNAAWRSPYLWGPMLVIFAIDIANGMAFLFPSVPSINVRFLVGRLADVLPSTAGSPFTALGWTSIGIFPFMAAIGLFMPSDLLFSAIFFFAVRKALQVGMELYGYEQGVFGGGWLVPAAPYFSEQTWGAVIALFIGAIVTSKGYLAELWRHIRHGTAFDGDDLRPRHAMIGLVCCLCALAALGVVVGLPAWLVLCYVLLFLVFSVVLTRIRAQLGPPIHEMAFLGPHQVLLGVGGFGGLSESANVQLYHLFFVTNRIHRTHPMPYQLEGMMLGRRGRISPRLVFAILAIAVIAGTVAGQLAHTMRGYIHGAQPAWGEPSAAVRSISEKPQSGGPAAPLAMLTGFAVVLLLDAVRFQYPGFLLHPVGYALSMNFGIDYCWFGLLIALIMKLGVQRYYGLRGFERLRIAAIGVILGEFTAELIWSSYSMLTQTVTYSVSFYNRAGWLQ